MPSVETTSKSTRRKVISNPASTVNDRPTVDPVVFAVQEGDAYTINSGLVPLTKVGSAVLYFKNGEGADFFIEEISIGIGMVGTAPVDTPVVTLIRDPTGGTIVSDAIDATKANRNINSANTLDAATLAYVGADSGTMTGGTTLDIVYVPAQHNFSYLNPIVVQDGKALGVEIDLNATDATVILDRAGSDIQDRAGDKLTDRGTVSLESVGGNVYVSIFGRIS